MMRKSVSRSAVAMALMLGAGAAMGGAIAIEAPNYEPIRMSHGFGGYSGYAPMTYGHRGAGITMAQQQRASQKRKNVKRHRRHVRG